MSEDFETVRYHLVKENPDSTTELDAYTALDRIESQLRSLTEENERLREALARWHVLHPEPHEDPGDNA